MSQPPRSSVTWSALRIAASLSIVVALACDGFAHRSPWTIGLAVPALAALCAIGERRTRAEASQRRTLLRKPLALLLRVLIQAVIGSVAYLIGLGAGALLAPAGRIEQVSEIDVWTASVFLVLATGIGVLHRWLNESDPDEASAPPQRAPREALSVLREPSREEGELDLDPAPLSIQTFFHSPGYWRRNTAKDAMERRCGKVEKPAFAASEAMIEAAEARLGVRLPETLRKLYASMDGGYLGAVFVPRGPRARPVRADWRAAFSPDCPKLEPLSKLRTLAEQRSHLTTDHESLLGKSSSLIVLHARHGDMTMLDYSSGAQPRVLIVDLEKPLGVDPVDVVFENFDDFLAALRRPRIALRSPAVEAFGPRLGDVPEAHRVKMFWGQGWQHAFRVNALRSGENAFAPLLAADDVLVAGAEARLDLRLPRPLVDLWRYKNGGGVACRFVKTTALGGESHAEVMRFPVPIEYFVTLAELSDRITFPCGETPWKALFTDPERLLVLEADGDRLLLLDYRGGQNTEPSVRVLHGLDRGTPREIFHAETFEEMLCGLRARRYGVEDVAHPWTPEVARADDRALVHV